MTYEVDKFNKKFCPVCDFSICTGDKEHCSNPRCREEYAKYLSLNLGISFKDYIKRDRI